MEFNNLLKFGTYFVDKNPWDSKVEITLMDNSANSSRMNNDLTKIVLSKLVVDCLFDISLIMRTSFLQYPVSTAR